MKSWIKELIVGLTILIAVACSFVSLHYATVSRTEASSLRSSYSDIQRELSRQPVLIGPPKVSVPVSADEGQESKPSFSTDQMLASLSTNVTIMGGVVAFAALAVGVLALFGYSELRTATFRKTEEDLVKIIRTLSANGELSAAAATVLLQSVVPDRIFTVGAGTSGILADVPASKEAQESVQNDDSIAEEYPGDK